jgi:YD repeat-containing protein
MIAALLGTSILAESAWARPVDLSAPTTELGAAGSKGYLEIWKEVEGVGFQLGKSYLPLRYKFTSDPSVRGILGPGFYMPMFEARSLLIRDKVMRASLPCGKVIYFWQDPVDPNKFQSVDKEWTGVITGKQFTVSRDDGWTIVYDGGRLSSITTDDHHVFTWIYSGSIPVAVNKDGSSVITVEPGVDGGIKAIDFGGKSYQANYGQRPMMQIINGVPIIQQLASELTGFKNPDGKGATFTFELTPQRAPTLTLNDNGQETTYIWNPTSNYLVNEDGPGGKWTYSVGRVNQEFGIPPLSRKNSDGKTEGVEVDNKAGIYTRVGTDGVKTVTQVFETPGPLYLKVRNIEQISGKVTTTIMRASYDEAGRMIRKIDGNGNLTIFTYDKSGTLLSQSHSLTKEKMALLAAKEKSLIQSIATAPTLLGKQQATTQLGFFYIHEMRDLKKASAVAAQLSHDSAYMIRIQMIETDETLSRPQKAEECKALLKEYPRCERQLNFLINAYLTT